MRSLIFNLLRPCIDYYLLLKDFRNVDQKRRDMIAKQITQEHKL